MNIVLAAVERRGGAAGGAGRKRNKTKHVPYHRPSTRPARSPTPLVVIALSAPFPPPTILHPTLSNCVFIPT